MVINQYPLNKAKIPIISPILENGLFITDFTENAQLFNDYFILQCTTTDSGSELPQHVPVPTSLINDFNISEEKILNIIGSLNPNKAHGWDEIFIIMMKISDVSLLTPLKIIFTTCLRQGVFPEILKCTNVVPVHKKSEKNVKSNYHPISLLPIFGKMYKISFTTPYTCILLHVICSTPINQVFVLVTQQLRIILRIEAILSIFLRILL